MQSTWGPRVFWGVVFLLVIAAVYALFYDPQPEVGRIGSTRPAENLLTLSPRLTGFELQVGTKDQVPTEWIGRVVFTGGKILQLSPAGRTANWQWTGDQFRLITQRGERDVEPVVLYLVADPGDAQTVHITLNGETKALPLSELSRGKMVELFDGKARLRRAAPVQVYTNDNPADDLAPTVTQDESGNAYLVYLACAKNKGVDVNALVSGTFDSLEKPVTGATLRLSRFAKGSWQYSDPVGDKLDSALNPVAVIAANRLYVAWSQQGPDGWDIYYTVKDFTDAPGVALSWSPPVKVTAKPGAHQDLVAVADSKGRAWLAWQTWHHDHFEIYAAVLNDTRHAWAKPGPVAEHARDEEGRWNPALAADKQGNVFVAWSVFRGGHFDVALTRLGDNTAAGPPTYVAASERQEQRPALRCDTENNLWVAYEESEADSEIAHDFAAAALPVTKIRVRLVKPDLKVEDLPPVPRPLRAAAASPGTPACRWPQVLLTKSSGLMVSYESQRRLYLTRLKNDGWSEPEELVTLPDGAGRPAVTYQDEHVCAFFGGADPAGHARLCLATMHEPAAAAATVRRTPVAPEALAAKELPEWKRFAENARQFRQRPEDLILFKKYLLRGLLLSDASARELGADGFAVAQNAFERGVYDWVAIPKPANAPLGAAWLMAERALALSHGERQALTGFHRAMTGQRQGHFVLDHQPLDAVLPSLIRLQSLQGDGRGTVVGSQAMDQAMLTQYLVQSQSVGFLLTEDWRLLATLNKPTGGSAFSDPTENAVIPFWFPAAEPGRPAPPGVRVVAYAAGKSSQDLLEALHERRFYIATDDIHLLARCDRRTPGEIFQTSFQPKINVVVRGTGKLARVEVWLDDKLVKHEEPPGAVSVLEYENTTTDGAWHSYTIRVVQADGAMAVTQPFWIRYLP